MTSNSRRRDVMSIVVAVSLSSAAVLGMTGCSAMLRRLRDTGRQEPQASTHFNERPENDSSPMYDMKVTGKWLSTNYSGKKMLVVDFDFTNDDVDPASPSRVAYGFHATQAGNKLDTGYLDDKVDGAMNTNEAQTDVAPSAKGKGQAVFVLVNDSDDVSLQFSCYSRDYTQQPITYEETVKLVDVQTKQSDVGVKAEIGKAYAYTDSLGKRCVFVEVTYTNETLEGGRSKTSMLSAIRADAKQGNSTETLMSGMHPKDGFPADYDKRIDAATQDVQKGQTVQAAETFALEDGNDSQTLHLKLVANGTPDMVVLAEKDIDLSTIEQLPHNDASTQDGKTDPFDNASV